MEGAALAAAAAAGGGGGSAKKLLCLPAPARSMLRPAVKPYQHVRLIARLQAMGPNECRAPVCPRMARHGTVQRGPSAHLNFRMAALKPGCATGA